VFRFGADSLPQRVSAPLGGKPGAYTPGTSKKGESMDVVIAVATVVLAVVAVLEFVRRKAG
jgi:hypothetical protein